MLASKLYFPGKLFFIAVIYFGSFLVNMSAAQNQYVAEISKSAVIIVDMQTEFFQRKNNEHEPALNSLITAQKELLNWAVEKNIPIIFFEFKINNLPELSATDCRLRQIPEDAIEENIDGVDGVDGVDSGQNSRFDHFFIIKKNTDDAFDLDGISRVKLMDTLKMLGTNTLIVSGINGGACVKETVEGALYNSLNLHVITSADLVADLNEYPPDYPYDLKSSSKNLEVFNNYLEIFNFFKTRE